MSFNKTIKSDASKILLKNWLKIKGINFIWLLIFLMFSFIELLIYILFSKANDYSLPSLFHLNNIYISDIKDKISSSSNISFLIVTSSIYILGCAIISIFKMGETSWYCKTIFHQNNSFLTIFSYFSSFKNVIKCWYISIQIFIRKIIWSIIIFLPSILLITWTIFASLHQNLVSSTYLISFGYILSILLIISSIVTCIIFFRRYLLTRYLITSGQCKTVRQAIKLSIKIMKGQKLNYIFLIVSFFLWIMLIFIFLISLIYFIRNNTYSYHILSLFMLCITTLITSFIYSYINISSTLYSRYVCEYYYNESPET